MSKSYMSRFYETDDMKHVFDGLNHYTNQILAVFNSNDNNIQDAPLMLASLEHARRVVENAIPKSSVEAAKALYDIPFTGISAVIPRKK